MNQSFTAISEERFLLSYTVLKVTK